MLSISRRANLIHDFDFDYDLEAKKKNRKKIGKKSSTCLFYTIPNRTQVRTLNYNTEANPRQPSIDKYYHEIRKG